MSSVVLRRVLLLILCQLLLLPCERSKASHYARVMTPAGSAQHSCWPAYTHTRDHLNYTRSFKAPNLSKVPKLCQLLKSSQLLKLCQLLKFCQLFKFRRQLLKFRRQLLKLCQLFQLRKLLKLRQLNYVNYLNFVNS